MKKMTASAVIAGVALGLIGLSLWGCEDQSENIPTAGDEIAVYMEQGWAEYAAGDFAAARMSFIAANQRNALYLPAYNGLGWCAVRLTNFPDAEVQFSFITTLANDTTQADLLADAYAGLCLSSAIHRSVLEISGENDPVILNGLALQAIQRADSVFALQGENYNPADHDPNLGSQSLHLLNAQNYFYLQQFESSEEQLAFVDANFVDSLLSQAGYGVAVQNEIIALQMSVVGQDTSWYLSPAHPGIHNVTSASPSAGLGFEVLYAENKIQVLPEPGVSLSSGMNFTVSYVYIEAFAEYLYLLIERIEELIEI